MKLDKYLEKLCEHYTKGRYEGVSIKNMGKRITANKHIDFIGFYKYLSTNTSKKKQTIRQYLSILHNWNIDFTKENIENFDDVTDFLFETKEQGLSTTNYQKKDSKNIDKKRRRFKSNLLAVLRHYVKFKHDKVIKDILEDEKKFKGKYTLNPRKTPHKEFMEEEIFKRYIATFNKDDIFRKLFIFLFYTGARISETLQMRKNKLWFKEIVEKNGKYFIPHKDRMLTITIPVGYAKTDEDGSQQKLYIPELDIREEIIAWLNNIPDNYFIFDFINKGGLREDKSYLDIVNEMYIIRNKMRTTMLNSGFEVDFIEKFTIHSWRVSNIHYTQSITGLAQETQKRARHSSIGMTSYYLQTSVKHFEENLFTKTQKHKQEENKQ